MSFRFNFDLSSEDVDIDLNDAAQAAESTFPTADSNSAEEGSRIPAKLHTLDELISLLPSQIAYSTIHLAISGSHDVFIPRRELFDVKMQLMSEDSMDQSTLEDRAGELTEAIVDEDIRTYAYEGGLKSWECSSDLVKYLAEGKDMAGDCRRIIELGCGTALPSCYILQQLLRRERDAATTVNLTLADYNIEVLRLVTLPNLLLNYLFICDKVLSQDTGELEITPEIVTSFTAFLQRNFITLDFISGSWGSRMISLISAKNPSSQTPIESMDGSEKFDLIIASETIYSLSSLPDFVSVIEKSMNEEDGSALVAAKDVYFGVGGSIDDFVAMIRPRGMQWDVVREVNRGQDGSRGVGRIVGRVTKAR